MRTRNLLVTLALCLAATQTASADLKMSSVFGDSMVVQRDAPIRVWGWTTPGTDVSVSLAGKSATGKAGDDGRFDVSLPKLPAGGPHELTVEADETKTFTDVLVGEVWICSGQSNMQWSVVSANDADMESLTAKFPNLRLITVPQTGTQEPQHDFAGKWQACTPESVRDFSAVGYFFGRQLHQTLDVPVGLIDNAWGGSSAEAWVDREVLANAGSYDDLLAQWAKTEATYDHDAEMAKYKTKRDAWTAAGKKGNAPRAPRNTLAGQHRPGNLYNGVLMPVLGYTIKGTIWYQGESNADRAYQYRELFPLMIQTWRDDWKQGDFPFYWVQLADFRPELDAPADSSWAELREAQTMTMSKLPNTGEAVILNLGEATDIHPKNKQDVAKRLARWALANEYGYEIPFRSPTFKSAEQADGKLIVSFDHLGSRVDTFDVREPIGFTVAGADKKFYPATAKIVGKASDQIEVSSDQVATPVAVRYAWADNPICNVQSTSGLPLTPFRSDDWPGITANKATR